MRVHASANTITPPRDRYVEGVKREFTIGVLASLTASAIWWMIFGGAASGIVAGVGYFMAVPWSPIWLLVGTAVCWLVLIPLGVLIHDHGVKILHLEGAYDFGHTAEQNHALEAAMRTGSGEYNAAWIRVWNEHMEHPPSNGWTRTGFVISTAAITVGLLCLVGGVTALIISLVG